MSPRSSTGANRSSDPAVIDPDVVEHTIARLSASDEGALAKAASEGLPDRSEVAEWVERTKRLALMRHERSALRSEVPYLAERLRQLLGGILLPEGVLPHEVVERFLPRLPLIRSLLAEDVEAPTRAIPPRAALRRSSSRIRRSVRSRSTASRTSCIGCGCRSCRA